MLAKTRIISVAITTTILLSCSYGGPSNKGTKPNTNQLEDLVLNEKPKSSNPASIIINEVSSNSGKESDWVELFNDSASSVDLGGFRISDSVSRHSYEIPKGSILKSGHYLVINQDKTGENGFDFGLGSKDSVRLFDSNSSLIDSVRWNHDDVPKNGSWGRIPDSTGSFSAHYVPTKGLKNLDNGQETRLSKIRAKYPRYNYDKTHNSDYLFNQEKLQRYDLFLEDSGLAYLNNDPSAEKYVEGALLHEGQLVSKVGIRYKGSGGSFYGCISGKNPRAPSGKKTCTKISMKIKINWHDRNDLFYGLKKLQFHSQNHDPSKMHERLGFWLFGQFGATTPRMVHAKLYINGEYNGLFSLTEQIDGRFAKRNFSGSEGNIYKETWPVDSSGNAKSESRIRRALKTNEEKADVGDFFLFSNAVASLDEKLGKAQVDRVMQEWFDIDSLMRTIVVDRAIAGDDGPYHWYCDPGCWNHNYYWFQDAKSKRVSLIRSDLDAAFDNLSETKHPYTYIEDQWNQTRNECEPFESGPHSRGQRSAACDKLLRAVTIYEAKYNKLRKSFEQQYFNTAIVGKMLDKWSAQIESAVSEAAVKHSDQKSVNDWKQAVAKLKGDIEGSLMK